MPAFVRFVVDGAGTPAPVAQTDRLVVGGPYRFVRNPMYVAVLLSIVGQAVLLGRWVLVVYGADYEAYRRAVPGWWPRPRAWFRG